MRRMSVALFTATILFLFGSLCRAAGDAEPVGTIELKGGSVAVGVGFSWASGTLTYKGKQYPITADGFDVGDVGVTDVRATGKVYNMTSLSDFDGAYSGFSAGATLVAGGAAVAMTNQNGVHMELTSGSEGVKFTFSGGTVNFKIKK